MGAPRNFIHSRKSVVALGNYTQDAAVKLSRVLNFNHSIPWAINDLTLTY